jgi:Protein of Unknown function (DUF2784)
MAYRLLADAIVLLHLAFVAFVLLGGFLVLRWRRSIWIHGPAVLWGAVVEWSGWACPLTPLENWLRLKGQARDYAGGFVEHYVVSVLYPEALTPAIQVVLGGLVIVVNLLVYGYALRVRRRRARAPGSSEEAEGRSSGAR